MERDFHADPKDVASALRASLAAMVASVGLDPQDPQSLAKKWGVIAYPPVPAVLELKYALPR